jgi:hypothetical protein
MLGLYQQDCVYTTLSGSTLNDCPPYQTGGRGIVRWLRCLPFLKDAMRYVPARIKLMKGFELGVAVQVGSGCITRLTVDR